MADREITFTSNVQGVRETTDALKAQKAAFDEAAQAAQRYSAAQGGAASGGSGGTGPSAAQRGRGATGAAGTLSIPSDIAGPARGLYEESYRKALSTYGPDIAARGARATVQQRFGSAAFSDGPTGASTAGPSATHRSYAARGIAVPGDIAGPARDLYAATFRAEWRNGPAGADRAARATVRQRFGPSAGGPGGESAMIQASSQSIRQFAQSLAGVPLSAAAAGAAVAALAEHSMRLASVISNTAHGYGTLLGGGADSGLAMAMAYQNQALGYGIPSAQTQAFAYASSAELAGRGVGPSAIRGMVPGQVAATSILGEAYAGPGGAGRSAGDIQQALLRAQSNANMVQSAGWDDLFGLQDQGLPISRILAEHMNRKYGRSLTPQAEELELRSGFRVSAADLSGALGTYAQTPEMQARAAAYRQSYPGQAEVLRNQLGAGLGSGARDIMEGDLAPMLRLMTGSDASLGGVLGAGRGALDLASRSGPLAGGRDAVLAVQQLSTEFTSLYGSATMVGGAFDRLGTGIHDVLARIGINTDDWKRGGGGGPPGPSGGGGLPGAGQVQSYIAQRAAALGMDPNVALAVAAQEGGFDPSHWGGDKGSASGSPTSFGPFQLHYGGLDAGGIQNGSGLGDDFTARTGLNAADPSTWQAQTDYALQWAAQHGYDPNGTGFHGADKVPGAPLSTPAAGGVHIESSIGSMTVQVYGDLSDPTVLDGLAGAIALKHAQMLAEASNAQAAP